MQINNNISIISVFSVGFLSFFSGCVIPILPIYMGYLSGNVEYRGETPIYNRKTTFINTIFFVFGISVVFFILGLGSLTLSIFFAKNNSLFTIIAGIIILIFGLIQLNVINIKFLKKEKHLKHNINLKNMNILKSFLLGFCFSFAWTPCTSITLSSILLYAATSQTAFYGNMLIAIYTLGFTFPFILLGLFTTEVLNLLKKNTKIIPIASKVGAILLILIGILTITGYSGKISQFFIN